MKKDKTSIIVILIMIIVTIGVAIYVVKNLDSDEPKKENNTPVSVDTIKNYDYVLEDRDTKTYKEEYKNLKKVLEGKEIDYEKYAESIAKLYIIDLYTISNKISKYDVGGTEFVYPDTLENYELKVRDTLYKYVEDNSYNSRTQELPTVKEVEISNIKTATYKIGDSSFEGYTLNATWTYEKDMGYDKEAKITIIKKENKCYVVESVTEQKSE